MSTVSNCANLWVCKWTLVAKIVVLDGNVDIENKVSETSHVNLRAGWKEKVQNR